MALGLGANQGSPRATLRRTVGQLELLFGSLRLAPLYRSAARSPVAQAPFLNTAVVATTTFDPADLMAVLKLLEWRAGRRPGPRMSPRPLDVDLLLYGDRELLHPELTLPHPRLRERHFVLAPLADIAPTLRIPPDGATAAELLCRLPPDPSLERLSWEE